MINLNEKFISVLSYEGNVIASETGVLYEKSLKEKGLIGSSHFPKDSALFFPNVNRLHSKGVLFPFDAVFLKKGGEIISLHKNIPPETELLMEPTAKHLVELPAGTIASKNLMVGKKLRLGK